MNKILTTALVILLPFTTLLAQEGAKPKTPPVKVAMKKFDKALDAVGDFLEKPEGKAPLAKLAEAQLALIESKRHMPRSTENQPAEKRAEFVRNYRIQINKTMRSILDLEDAMLKQDYEAANEVMKQLKQQKKAGHKTFKGRRRRRGASGAGKK